MMKSQDFRDNRAEVLLLSPRDLHSGECLNTGRLPRDRTNPPDHRDRKPRRWTQTTPLTLRLRLSLRKQSLKQLLLQLKVQEKVLQGQRKCLSRASLLGKVLKAISKAKLKGLNVIAKHISAFLTSALRHDCDAAGCVDC